MPQLVPAAHVQVDGEPFELEPMFAPRKAMTISVRHHNQAVMLSQSRVRADGVALEALDWVRRAFPMPPTATPADRARPRVRYRRCRRA